MRILHTGDLHLDSPFAGLDIARSEKRRRECRDTFCAMMRYAREEKLDMVVIAGDLFDGAFVTRETLSLLSAEFAALSCPVIIAPGNHDPYTADSLWDKASFPDNVYIFRSADVERLSFDGLCDVYGYAFTDRYADSCLLSGSVEDSGKINILVAHGDCMSPISRYAPLPAPAIRAFGADYAALGHIHNPMGTKAALKGINAAYCGCPEGRDFGEIGEKGAILADITKEGVSLKKLRFSKRVYYSFTLDVTGAQTTAEVSAAISRKIADEGYGSEHLIRMILSGDVSPSLVIDCKALSEDPRGLFWLEIEDSTAPTLDAEALYADKGIRGELYRTLLPHLESEDRAERSRGAAALRYALGALAGEDITDF